VGPECRGVGARRLRLEDIACSRESSFAAREAAAFNRSCSVLWSAHRHVLSGIGRCAKNLKPRCEVLAVALTSQQGITRSPDRLAARVSDHTSSSASHAWIIRRPSRKAAFCGISVACRWCG
jgi:hypothetical protein